jgi:hypothetical protein
MHGSFLSKSMITRTRASVCKILWLRMLPTWVIISTVKCGLFIAVAKVASWYVCVVNRLLMLSWIQLVPQDSFGRYIQVNKLDRYTCYIYVTLGWVHKIRDIKQDWVVFKSATQHQLELQLHLIKPKIMTNVAFWNTKLFLRWKWVRMWGE